MIIFGFIIILILVMTFDLGKSASVYLYFYSEIGLLLFSLAIYFSAFEGKKWNDPPEKDDNIPQPDHRKFIKELSFGFISLAVILCGIWILKGVAQQETVRSWLKSGFWFLYYIGVFGVSAIIIRRHMQYVHSLAMVVSVIIMVYIAATYEILLLSHGTGWQYNNTIIGWILETPVENVLFIYPVAPALTMIFYSVISRRLNDIKAFWLINLILIPCSVAVELIGIYPLNLWYIFNDASVLPLGKTNLEEFIYYILFQFLSIVLYVFLSNNFKKRT